MANRLRASGANDITITILSAESFPEYDPCSLPYFVGKEIEREAVFRKSMEDYTAAGIRLVLNQKAVAIDPARNIVTTETGDEYPYDKLVLAHGGSLFIPPIPGIDKQGIFSCKQLGEADRLAAGHGKTAVVVGSGAIGIEAAEALKLKGCAVYIVELLPWMMPTLFCEPAARRLEEAMRGYGIEVLTGEKVLSFEGDQSVTAVVTDKRTIACDTVVVATGVVPGRPLAETAGIKVARGILVNEKMETSAQNIYSCGDCVQSTDALTGEACMYQLKHNAIEQARIVARNILGEDAIYPGGYPFARAHFFDTYAVTFGKTLKSAESVFNKDDINILERENQNGYLRLLLHDGRVIGGQAIGRYADYTGLFMGFMWRKDDVRELMANWGKIASVVTPYPWQFREFGRLIGLSALDADEKAINF